MERFLEIYGTLPRAGPGSNDLTRRALCAMTTLPFAPKILDVGCGPGKQTIELLKLSNGPVVAVDLLPEMIERVKTAAVQAGVSDQLETLQLDMLTMEFAPSSFDVVWSEGAIYVLGFEKGLERFKPWVKPGGYVAVSEAVWLQANPPDEAIEFWREYPEIASVEEKLQVIKKLCYEIHDSFVFPCSAWNEEYYDPMEQRIEEKSEAWKGIPEAETLLNQARHEISVFRRCSEFYGYAFFVMQKPIEI